MGIGTFSCTSECEYVEVIEGMLHITSRKYNTAFIFASNGQLEFTISIRPGNQVVKLDEGVHVVVMNGNSYKVKM